MWKIIFIKYLPPARSKLFPKLKVLRTYWNLVQLILWISRSRFWCQKLFLLNTTCYAQIGPKIKSAQNLLKFGTFNISNTAILMLVSKMVFMKYLPGQINVKVKIDLKFKFDISSILILTMRSDKSFIKHLLHVMVKLVSDFEFQSRL